MMSNKLFLTNSIFECLFLQVFAQNIASYYDVIHGDWGVLSIHRCVEFKPGLRKFQCASRCLLEESCQTFKFAGISDVSVGECLMYREKPTPASVNISSTHVSLYVVRWMMCGGRGNGRFALGKSKAMVSTPFFANRLSRR